MMFERIRARIDRFLRPRLFQAVAGLLALGTLPAFGQYQVHYWANFESGKLPEQSITIGPAPLETISVVRLSDVGIPPAINQADGSNETGEYVLRLTADPKPNDFKSHTTGLAVGTVLDRDKLGSKGRAIYQADFYLPPEGPLPSLAVLAMEPPAEVSTPGHVDHVVKPFARFGISKGRQLYYSTFFPRNKEKAVFYQDPELLELLPRGWHRFAIVMEGSETIRCYVDGRETNFSPFKEPNLRQLMVGIMLADNERSYTAYVDNLSIQVSDDAPALPDSPYTQGWTIPAGPAQARKPGNAASPSSLAATRALNWMEPVAAWSKAQKENKPLLLYFYGSGLPGSERMDNILATNPSARQFLQNHVAARVDVNQLQGSVIARQYEVYKVPTLLVISPDARSYRRVVPAPTDTWEIIAPQLKLP